MNYDHKLKMKPSAFLVISRILAAILVLSLIGIALLGMIGPRTQDTKQADLKVEFSADFM